MNFKSLPQLLDYFKEEETCIKYYEQIRWGSDVTCVHCENTKVYRTNRGYKCASKTCGKKFTVRTGTIFEHSNLKLRIWFGAIFLATVHKKGISSVQLGLDLGIKQSTAWHVLHRIREMLAQQAPQMLGENAPVEADESYIGGREINRHNKKKRSEVNPDLSNDGKPYNKKKVVVGLIERNGNVILKYVPNATTENMVPFIKKHVPNGSTVFTDESKVYKNLHHTYSHGTVVHSLNVYVVGDVHTNTIENFWSVLKRGLYGIYHQVSDKHFERYLHEFSARFNSREIGNEERLVKFLQKSESPLPYKKLIA